jgi:hypothetical protein
MGVIGQLALAFTLVFATAGCAGYIGHAKRAYQQGRYLEAAEQLGERESEVSDLTPRKQAEYGLYRGLSLMMLSDYPGAIDWFEYAYAVERRFPGSLTPTERKDLDRGFHRVTQGAGRPQPGFALVPRGPGGAPAMAPPPPPPSFPPPPP